MNITDDVRLEVLADHYKDTCQQMCDQVSGRNKLFLYILACVGISFFQISDPKQSAQAVGSLLNSYLGIKVTANGEALNSMLWFLLLSFSVRYFQANIFVNRQYDYIHDLEDKFTEMFGRQIISREGKSYLNKYPYFSKWIHLLYTWIFPSSFLLVISYKIYSDWPGILSGFYIFSGIIYFATVISTIFYLCFIHRKV